MDTDTDRSQILADFQACANIDDIEHALAVLEAANWDLAEAYNMTVTNDTPQNFMNDNSFVNDNAASTSRNGGPLQIGGEAIGVSFPRRPNSPVQRRSSPILRRTVYNRPREMIDDLGVSRRLIRFHAQYNDELLELELMDSETVEELKDRLAAKIEKDRSEFAVVWQDQRITAADNNTLRELNLPGENTLRIVPLIDAMSSSTPTFFDPYDVTSIIDRNKSYALAIEITTAVGAQVTREFSELGSKTVKQVKTDIESSYGIPVSDQNWNGWSSHVTDDMTLAVCQLTEPTHTLTVCRRGMNAMLSRGPSTSTASSSVPLSIPRSISDSESDHDYDMMDDDHELDMAMETSPPTNNQTHLIPAGMDNISEAAVHFNAQFAQRYGSNGQQPSFYSGTLKEAVDASLQCSASQRRLLAIYLHHDGSIAANVFCTQVLCSETVVNYLSSNFVTWGWDLTLPGNKRRLVDMFGQVAGKSASDFVKHLGTDDLPVLVVLAKTRGSLEILGVSRAGVSTEDVMTTLLQAEDVFQDARNHDIREEQERKEREEMKALQDAAYDESLAQDRVKEMQKEKEERQKRDDLLAEMEAQRLEQQTIEAMKQSVADSIPEEPPADCADVVARLRFRCPDGSMINRRFLGSTQLNTLFNYLVIEGYRREEFKVLTTFPRRDLTQEDGDKSLEQLKLCPQETLILEAR